MDLISVTTLLKWFDNEALQNYKMNLVKDEAERAILEGSTPQEFRSQADLLLSNNKDAVNGTRFHAYAEAVAKGETGTFDIEAESKATQAFIAQFEKWLVRYSPKFTYSEVPLYSEKVGYAGTCDAIVEIDGKSYLLDYKTSSSTKKPWRSVRWQLAAYRGAEKMAPETEPSRIEKQGKRFYRVSDAEYASMPPMVAVDGCLVVQISPYDISTYEVDVTSQDYKYFAYITKAHHASSSTSWAKKWN